MHPTTRTPAKKYGKECELPSFHNHPPISMFLLYPLTHTSLPPPQPHPAFLPRLNVKKKLGFKTISEIFKSGFSRLPVYDKDKNDIVGVVFTKDLIFVDPEDEMEVRGALGGRVRGKGMGTGSLCLDERMGSAC